MMMKTMKNNVNDHIGHKYFLILRQKSTVTLEAKKLGLAVLKKNTTVTKYS